MDSKQFAQTVKAKYPQYAQVPDDVLAQKIVQKYPQYAKAIQPSAPQGQPQVQPQAPPQGQAMPPGQPPMPPPQMQPPQQPPQGPNQMDPSALLKAYARTDPQGAQALLGQLMGSKFGPGPSALQQSEVAKNNAMAQRYSQMGSGPSGKSTWYETPDGNISRNPSEGAFPIQISDAQGAQYTAVPKSKGAGDGGKGPYYKARATLADVGSIAGIEKNIDPSHASRTSPLGAAASSVRRSINGLSLLQQPTVTNTALQSVVGDIDSIVTQGAATVEGRKALGGSNVYQKIQQFKSDISSHPENTPVPPGTVKLYKDILQDLGPVSQKFVSDYVNQQSFLYKKKALQVMGPDEYEGLKKRILDSYNIQGELAASPNSGKNGTAVTQTQAQTKVIDGKTYVNRDGQWYQQ